eukprot:7463721-Ditylum_brightwellii.AAC.1
MERTEIAANVRSAGDATNDSSTVQPRQDSQVMCSASEPYSTELDGWSNLLFSGSDNLVSGVTAHSVRSELEQ